MANVAAAVLQITMDSVAAIESTEFLKKHAARIKQDEVMWERLQYLMDNQLMFILMATPEKKLHYTLEPSYPLIELMAELGR